MTLARCDKNKECRRESLGLCAETSVPKSLLSGFDS
jgi:hypothetical protein